MATKECLCHFLTLAGSYMDHNEQAKSLMDQYFLRLEHLLDTASKCKSELANRYFMSSRIRFMLEDLLDLRKNNWIPQKTGQKLHEDEPRFINQYIKYKMPGDSNDRMTPGRMHAKESNGSRSSGQRGGHLKSSSGSHNDRAGDINRPVTNAGSTKYVPGSSGGNSKIISADDDMNWRVRKVQTNWRHGGTATNSSNDPAETWRRNDGMSPHQTNSNAVPTSISYSSAAAGAINLPPRMIRLKLEAASLAEYRDSNLIGYDCNSRYGYSSELVLRPHHNSNVASEILALKKPTTLFQPDYLKPGTGEGSNTVGQSSWSPREPSPDNSAGGSEWPARPCAVPTVRGSIASGTRGRHGNGETCCTSKLEKMRLRKIDFVKQMIDRLQYVSNPTQKEGTNNKTLVDCGGLVRIDEEMLVALLASCISPQLLRSTDPDSISSYEYVVSLSRFTRQQTDANMLVRDVMRSGLKILCGRRPACGSVFNPHDPEEDVLARLLASLALSEQLNIVFLLTSLLPNQAWLLLRTLEHLLVMTTSVVVSALLPSPDQIGFNRLFEVAGTTLFEVVNELLESRPVAEALLSWQCSLRTRPEVETQLYLAQCLWQRQQLVGVEMVEQLLYSLLPELESSASRSTLRSCVWWFVDRLYRLTLTAPTGGADATGGADGVAAEPGHEEDRSMKTRVAADKRVWTVLCPLMRLHIAREHSGGLDNEDGLRLILAAQLDVVYLVQRLWSKRHHPRDSLLSTFICFYDLEIVEESVFFVWRAEKRSTLDESKGKALFEVSKWIDWLKSS